MPVGAGATPPHNARAFDNISISSGEGGGYRDGIPVEEVGARYHTRGVGLLISSVTGGQRPSQGGYHTKTGRKKGGYCAAHSCVRLV